MKKRRFIIAAGGTGGHFYPGLAIGLALQNKGSEVLFIVRKNEPAITVLNEHKLSYREIDLIGLPRALNPMRHIQFLGKLYKSIGHTRTIIREFKPDLVLGTGGYISFPLLVSAHFMGIKTAVHDSNSHLGLVNRICGRFATLFMLGLPLKNPPKNAILVSTPLRAEFAAPVNRKKVLENLNLSDTQPTVLVVGGSQGAKHLNESVALLVSQLPQWQFIHVTGTKWFDSLQEQYKKYSNVRALAYSHDIYTLMKSADITICRSGAGTIAELIACRLPAICVPFPHAAEDHQYYNAQILANVGAAEIIRENNCLTSQLQSSLQEKTPQILEQMRQAYQKVPIPDPLQAAQKIAVMLLELL